MELITEPNLARPDEVYEALIEAHRGLSPQQSQALNARLVLLLANHVGDMQVLTQAMRHARDAGAEDPAPPEAAAKAGQ